MTYLRALLYCCISLVTGLLFSACTKSVTVDSEFPVPLVEPLDLNIGVRYPEILANYVEVEEAPDISQWEIVLGDTNLRMFNNLFKGMFNEVVLIDQNGVPADTSIPIDAIIEPVLEDLQISVPAQSGTELYGVWLKYTLKVSTPDGTPVTSWPVTGFGQVAKNRFTSAGPVRAAAIMAMRDAGTNIILGFVSQPDIRDEFFAEPPSTDNDPDTNPQTNTSPEQDVNAPVY